MGNVTPGPPPPVLYKLRVITPVLNVRGGPGVSFPIVGTVAKDEILSVYLVAQPSGWFKIDPVEDRYITSSVSYTVRI